MNNIFNIRRFGLVLSKDFHEKWKKYGLQFLTMFGIVAVIFTWYPYGNGHVYNNSLDGEFLNRELLRCASFLFFGFGIFYASTLMDSMREKTKRIAYLTMPASNFEKFLSRWLIVTIGFIIAFFIALWLADAIRVSFLSYKFPESDIRFLDFNMLINPEAEVYSSIHIFPNKHYFRLCIGFYVLLQSLFILGATFWEKFSFIKTFSAATVIVLSFLLLNYWIIKIVHHDINGFGNAMDALFSNLKIQEKISENTALLIITCFLSFCALFNWIIAYFRFRESEIIKRL